MRILRIIATIRAETGGPVEGMTRSTLALSKRGHHTEVVTLDPPSEPQLQDKPFPVHGLGRSGDRLFSRVMARWIVQNKSRFDVAVIHGLWNAASLSGWWGLRQAGLPYVQFTHGMLDPWFRQTYPLKHLAKQAYWLAGQGWALHDAQTVLFTSEEERRLARGMFIGPSYHERVVAYGSAEPLPPSPAQQAAFVSLVPGLRGRRYLLFLSRIHPKKGADLLVDAFIAFAGRMKDIDLVIAGPDQSGLVPDLQSQLAAAGLGARVHFPGMLKGDAKWGAFRGADAFILPSHQENFGIVVAEALSCGTPVLISDKVNIWREVADGQAGFVEPDTLAGTQALMSRLDALSDQARNVMKVNARNTYERRFSIEGAADDLLSVLKEAVVVRS